MRRVDLDELCQEAIIMEKTFRSCSGWKEREWEQQLDNDFRNHDFQNNNQRRNMFGSNLFLPPKEMFRRSLHYALTHQYGLWHRIVWKKSIYLIFKPRHQPVPGRHLLSRGS